MTKITTKPDCLQPATELAVDLFDNWFNPIETEVRARSRQFIEELIRSELDAALSRPRYGRSQMAGNEAKAGVKAIVPKIRTSGRGSLSHTSAARQRHAGMAQACVAIYCRRNGGGARGLQMNSSTSNLREIVSTGSCGYDLASSTMTAWEPDPATPMNAIASRIKRSDISSLASATC